MRRYMIAAVPGDGIGVEVTAAAVEVLLVAAERYDFEVDVTDVDVSARRYLAEGVLWNEQIEHDLSTSDAILLGAVGDPAVLPGVLERGFIVRLRNRFRQSVNVRPVSCYPGVENPYLRDTSECDLVIVRENTEGAYASEGSIVHRGTREAAAVQESINTYPAIERAMEFGFRLAAQRRGRITICHKMNIMVAVGNLWMDVLADVSPRYPDVDVDYVHVDAMAYHLLTNPRRFDVVVTDNLFGDILTDVAAVVQGGLGLAASANLNLNGSHPSMFEPVHGSAPDIAGRGIANPVGAVLSAVLCLGHLGEVEAAAAVERATAELLRTAEGSIGTAEAAARIRDHLTLDDVDTASATPLATLGHLARRSNGAVDRTGEDVARA